VTSRLRSTLTGAFAGALAEAFAGAFAGDVQPASAGGRKPALPGRDDTGRPVIVLIDNYDSFTYNLAHLLLRGGCQVEVVRNDEVAACDIAGFRPDGVVISPGPGTPADAGISVDTVRLCGPVTPLLGICLGHQAIAAAYGARVGTAPEPVHGQASPVTHDGRGVLSGLPQPFPAARYHSLIVEEGSLPPALHVTARGPGGIPMGIRHVRHPAEGLQFHPESILTPYGRVIIGNFIRGLAPAQPRREAPAPPRREAPAQPRREPQ
jgi:anthranilate synthase/aminodeoxychorismate synthase-like glutamine amidotransferase